MASRRSESKHAARLESLLAKSGLVCPRSLPSSVDEEEEEKEEEEIGEEEEEEGIDEVEPEEELTVAEEAVQEELPTIFPTPSLRRMIPERLRNIEAQNRIKVLPKKFLTDIDPDKIPKMRVTAPQVYIDILAKMTGCNMYKHNMAEYWFLDTLANLLRRAQEDKLDKPTQAVLILWFCEWMKEMEQFDAASRERMLRRWKDNMMNAARFTYKEAYLPTPSAAGVYYEAADSKFDQEENPPPPTDNKYIIFEDPVYECSMCDLVKILHYIYDLFSTDYQYKLIRMIFTFGPEYQLIHGPFQIETPKKQYVPQKFKPRKEAKAPKADKGKKASSAPDTAEYLALMELKNRELDQLYELEYQDLEDYNKRHSIVPLGFGRTEELFNMYFPPASTEELLVLAPPPPPEQPTKKKK